MKYGIQIIVNDFNTIFKKSILEIFKNGEWTNPRGFLCNEIIAPQIILTDPKNCLVTLKNRKLNYAYLIVEKMMYLSQVCYPEILMAYNAKMKDFLNQETDNFDGAYGPRIAKGEQLKYCYEQLKSDKDSRQAVVTINDFTDRRVSLDKPCTLSLQFLIRKGKLDLIVTMRSNDILWGLCLDVPAFCFLQEVMAFWLGIPVGNYIHTAASFHYYKEFEERLISFVDDNELNDEEIPEWDVKYEDMLGALLKFWREEKHIREEMHYKNTGYKVIDKYLERLYDYWLHKKIKLENV